MSFSGNVKALSLPYLKSLSPGQTPTYNGLCSFALGAKDLKYAARFNVIFKINLPAIVKRIGNRLNNIEVSNGASAMCALAAMTFPSNYYRDHYANKYINGNYHPTQDSVVPIGPRKLEDFLPQLNTDPSDNSELKRESNTFSCDEPSKTAGPTYEKYPPR